MASPAQQHRPVTVSDPAWFETVPMRLADGSTNPEYGCVFWSEGAEGSTRYDFDSAGHRFACTMFRGSHSPREGVIEVQNRLFRIAGPSRRQALQVAA
jgi:hypothetical protein